MIGALCVVRDAWCDILINLTIRRATHHAPRTTAKSMEIGFWRKNAYSRQLRDEHIILKQPDSQLRHERDMRD